MIELNLPPAVSANRYWSNYTLPGSKRAMRGPSMQAKVYKREIARIAGQSGAMLVAGFIDLTLILHPAEPKDAAKRAEKLGADWHRHLRSIDLDNALKVILDALQGIVYENDRQVVRITAEKGLPKPGGGVTVRVVEAA